jgi:hypothetical protein
LARNKRKRDSGRVVAPFNFSFPVCVLLLENDQRDYVQGKKGKRRKEENSLAFPPYRKKSIGLLLLLLGFARSNNHTLKLYRLAILAKKWKRESCTICDEWNKIFIFCWLIALLKRSAVFQF